MRAILFVVLISVLAAAGCNEPIYVEEETPPGSVPPPPPPPPQARATTHELGIRRDAPPVNAIMPTAVTREDEGRTLETHVAAIAEQFAEAYKAKENPRIAVFLNRVLSDEVRQWQTASRTVVTGNITAVEGASADTQMTPRRSEEHAAGGRIEGGEGSVYRQTHVEQAGRPDAPEDWRWQYEESFLRPFLDVRAVIIDRATILRLAAAASGRQGDPHDLIAVKQVEIDALTDKADVYIELLVRRNPAASVGYEFRATAKEVATGRILAMASSLRWQQEELDLSLPTRYAATAEGFQAIGEDPFPQLDRVARVLAADLMAQLTAMWDARSD